MKVAIHYFSGCGNSLWVALKAEKELNQSGHEVVLMQSSEQPRPAEIPYSDVDLFVFPVYFFGLAANAVTYLNNVPMVADRKAILWTVDGGFSGTARRYGAYLLKGRGYEVIATEQIEMPDTFLPLKKSQIDAQERQKVIQAAHAQIKTSLEVLSHLGALEMENKAVFALSGLVYFPYLYLFRHCLGFSFISKPNCISCQKCALNCPVKCIEMRQGRPHWHKNCVGCFRCVHHCPVAAIDFSKYAFLLGAIGSLAGWIILGSVLSALGPFMGGVGKWVGAVGGFVLGTFIFQKLYLMFPLDKGLVFKDKKRVLLSEEEKDL